jgi:RimJ/RimL family protein N-acetyltransferase
MALPAQQGARCTGWVPSPVAPPEVIDCGVAILTRIRGSDGALIAQAVRQSLDQLRPWLPWATEAAADTRAQQARSREAEELWDRGTDFILLLREPGSDAVIGSFGLHRRVGPDALELGYWLHQSHTGRGYATAAAAALTDVALGLENVHRVEIHTDEANRASAAIPQRLGYRLERVDTREPEAPGESGRLQIWIRGNTPDSSTAP